MSTIVVLVKHVPDSWSQKDLEPDFTLDRTGADGVIDEINEFAVEQALRLKESDPEAHYRVVALSAGPDNAEEALRKALSMGVDDAILLSDQALAGSDLLATAWALSNALNTIDDVVLVVAGVASSDGATGALPGILAEYRQVPALTNLSSVTVRGDEIAGVRAEKNGTYHLRAKLPAVISISEQAAKPRFPDFKGIMAAKKAKIIRLSLADIGVSEQQVGLAHAASAVTAATKRPERTQGVIISDGDAAEKIADVLVAEKFI